MTARASNGTHGARTTVICGIGALVLAIVAAGFEYIDATTRRLFGQSLLVTTPMWAIPAAAALLLAGLGGVAWLRARPDSAGARVGLGLCVIVLIALPLVLTREKTTEGHLVSLDPTTGAAMWDTSLPMSVVSDPSHEDDVIVTSGVTRCGEGSTVVGIDAATGDVRWERPADGFSQISGLAGGVGLVSDLGAAELIAFDARSGSELWRQSPERALSGGAAMEPTLFHSATLVLVAGPGGVVALDRKTGDELWSATVEPGRATEVASDGGATIALVTPGPPGQPGTVRGLDPDTGATRWETAVASLGPSSPIATEDTVVVSAAELEREDLEGSQLVGLSAADGHIMWQVRDPSPFDGTAPAVAAGVLARVDFGDGSTAEPALVGIDLATGATRWTSEAPSGGIWLSAGGDAVVMTGDGMVTAWDAATGDLRWSVESDVVAAHPSRAAVPVDGAVLLGDDGRSRSCSGIGS